MTVLKKITLKNKAGAERGTTSQEAVIDLCNTEWDEIQKRYGAMSPEE